MEKVEKEGSKGNLGFPGYNRVECEFGKQRGGDAFNGEHECVI
jgi:hypothetical protein